MKTLVNKNNPQIRITVPEIDRVCLSTGDDAYNVFIVKQWPLNSLVFFDTDWTLVEEEPTEGIKGNLEEIPSMDLEKEAKKIAYEVCKDLPPSEKKDSIVYYAILAAIEGARWMAEKIKGSSK